MKSVFEAANTVEAHMVLHLLQQQGVAGRVDGEYLAGAAGQLPAHGLVRVVVDEVDYDAAQAIVSAFEAAQPRDSGPKQAAPGGRWRWAMAGLLLGAVGTAALLRAPVSTDGVDYDHDGVFDERWTYSPSGQPLRMEADRNLDRRIDYIAHYERGLVASAESDDDFDGRFETRMVFRAGNVERSDTDADGDSFAELHTAYRDGVLDTTTVLNPSTGLPLQVEHYRLGRLSDAEVDTDRDGRLDTRLRFDPLGQVVAREPLP